MLMVKRSFCVLIIVLSIIVSLSSLSVSSGAKDQIRFIALSSSSWKSVGSGIELYVKLKNGTRGACEVRMRGAYLQQLNNNDYHVLASTSSSYGSIALKCTDGGSEVIDGAWTRWLTKYIGKVDLHHDGTEELFYISVAGNTAMEWNYNILSVNEKEVISYTIGLGLKSGGRDEYPSSSNFNDPKFKKEAKFLKSIAREFDLRKEYE